MSDTERDSRLGNRGTQSSPEREDRGMKDRSVTENRGISKEERLNLFRNAMFQSALPEIPDIPGYHVCWLTTTNARDSIAQRQILGYEPIKAKDVPGFELATLRTGEYAGCIGVNEMVAFKLPNELYEAFMTENHHDQPNAEEGKLRSVLEVIAEEARSRGADVELGDGTAELGKAPPKPKFEGAGPAV